MRVYGVVGWKNAGKTTLMEKLVAEIAGRGFSVSTVKHAHHTFDVDQPGKDSWRHRQAGAREVLVSAGARWALMHELRGAAEPPLEALLAKLTPVDLVLVEGYKRDRHPKVEAWRAATGAPLIARDDPTVRAVASNDPVEGVALPVLPLDDAAAVADFILAQVGLIVPAAPRQTGVTASTRFDTVVAVDWSASATQSPKKESPDAIWMAVARGGAVEPPSYHRTRAAAVEALAALMLGEIAAGRRLLVGLDFPFGWPRGLAGAVTGRAGALAFWDWLADAVTDGPDNANDRFAVAGRINRMLPGVGPFWGRPARAPHPDLPERGSARTADHGLPERRLVEERIRSAQPCWKLYTTGSVGSQALLGVAALARMRRDPRLAPHLAVWPFETGLAAPRAAVTLAEIYPSLWPLAPDDHPIKDAAQVRQTAARLAALDADGALAPLFAPDLPPDEAALVAREEGWILGVSPTPSPA